jgi:hypothetical protein
MPPAEVAGAAGAAAGAGGAAGAGAGGAAEVAGASALYTKHEARYPFSVVT